MTTKKANETINTMILTGELTKGMNDMDFTAAFAGKDAKEVDSMLNVFRQWTWDAPVAAEKPAKVKPVAKKFGDVILSGKNSLAAKAAKKAAKPAAKGKGKPAAKKTKAAPKTEKKPKRGTDARLRELILTGLTNANALAKVLKEFPEASTTIACASWNRSQLRNHPDKYGIDKKTKVLTDREAAEKLEKK